MTMPINRAETEPLPARRPRSRLMSRRISKPPPGFENHEEAGGLTFALQALLARHESYMAESEAERQNVQNIITTLEQDKKSLETRNNGLITQNRTLLEELEQLTNSLSDGDAHIKSLMATLSSAQFELKRLNGLATRTADLERQSQEMEDARLDSETRVEELREEKQSAVARWQIAERKLQNVQNQLEQVETEGRRERERHAKLVGRMERRRVAEDDLSKKSGQVGARTFNGGSTTVVSHFVKDILEDNATLQSGILELRELLETSNYEVQSLREQVLTHQPVPPEVDPAATGGMKTLEEELAPHPPSNKFSNEVHVHHHYHPKIAVKRDRTPVSRRGKKRGSIGVLSPLSSSPLPQSPPGTHRRLRSPFNQNTLPNRVNRWSLQSSATASTALSLSPRSYNRNSYTFDRMESGFESSRPTSPESLTFPTFNANKRQSFFDDVPEGRESFEDDQKENHNPRDMLSATRLMSSQDTISVQPFPSSESEVPPESHPDAGMETEEEIMFGAESASATTRMHHSTSHESLVSISGMDIHLAQRPKLRLKPITTGLAPISPTVLTTTSSTAATSVAPAMMAATRSFFNSTGISSSRPLATIAEVTAVPSSASTHNDRDQDSVGAGPSQSVAMLSNLVSSANKGSNSRTTSSPKLSRLVGGWMRGKWGVTPVASSPDLRGKARAAANVTGILAQTDVPAARSREANFAVQSANVNPFEGRTFGINQKGAIPGFLVKRTPSQIHAQQVDVGLLREALGDE